MKKSLVILTACILATPVSAATSDNTFAKDEAVLRLSGLDLSTVEGQERLAIRMDEAARTVCGDRLSSVHLALGARARDCQTAVFDDIRAQIEARAMAANTSPTQLASRN